MKPDDSTKNGLAAMPATAKLLRAFPEEVETVTCERCGERTPPLRSGLCLSCGRPRAGATEGEFEEKKSDVARGDDCCGTVAPLTLRERVARFIFPRRTVGEIPVEAMSPAVKWGSGDVMTTHVWGDVSFWDLLRLLFSRRLLIEVKTATELMPGHSVSRAVISVLPPQFLEPGPSGNWSPKDERDLFDLVAGIGGERPEHPCAECKHPDCFKGYLPGRFGEPGMGDACPECLAAGRLDFRDPDQGWKMTPRELALLRAATGDHVGGTLAVAGNTTVWAPEGGPVQTHVGPPGTDMRTLDADEKIAAGDISWTEASGYFPAPAEWYGEPAGAFIPVPFFRGVPLGEPPGEVGPIGEAGLCGPGPHEPGVACPRDRLPNGAIRSAPQSRRILEPGEKMEAGDVMQWAGEAKWVPLEPAMIGSALPATILFIVARPVAPAGDAE